MKQALHRFLSSLLALLVLASTVSWTVDRHLCMGRIMDVSLFAHAQDCGMGVEKDASCCADDSFTVQGQDHLKISPDDHGLVQPFFVMDRGPFQFLFLVGETQAIVFHLDYAPPPLVRDLQTLHQTFLI